MTSIRRYGWTTLALFALAGCGDTGNPERNSIESQRGPGDSKGSGEPKPSSGEKAPEVVKPLPVEPTPTPAPAPAAKPDEPKKEAAAGKLSDEEIAEIKKLPADEQPIALAQMTCPVSGDHLGEMGAPIKQVIGDKSFYICCAGCEKMVKKDPEGVLAKLKK